MVNTMTYCPHCDDEPDETRLTPCQCKHEYHHHYQTHMAALNNTHLGCQHCACTTYTPTPWQPPSQTTTKHDQTGVA